MRSVIARACTYGVGLLMIACAIGANVSAQGIGLGPAAPEIDGNSLATGLALLSGVVLILRSRRRAK